MTAADLRALSAAATPGPWVAYKYGVVATDRDGTPYEPCGDYQDDMRWADKELIVWLRNHADALADLIDAAQEVRADMAAGAVDCLAGDRLHDALAALEADQ